MEAGETLSSHLNNANSSPSKSFQKYLYGLIAIITFIFVFFTGLAVISAGLFKENVEFDVTTRKIIHYQLSFKVPIGLILVTYSIVGICLVYNGILCKKETESIFQMMLRTIYRAGFIPSLYYNVVLNKLNIRPWYNRVDDKVIIGALPWISIKDELIENENVQSVVSMNENFELDWLSGLVANREVWNKSKVKFLQLQTRDIFETPTQDKLQLGVDFIMCTKEGDSVYVHCKAGRTRSATLVCCYLMKRHNWTPAQACELLALKRPQLALYKPQLKALAQFYKENVETK